MPARVELHVRIGADGTVVAETHGITGTACLDYVSLLENLLEATTVDSTYTADYGRFDVAIAQEGRDELPQS
ncbi:DUF2997 domain-containing protein [Blastococcus sp. TF02A-26]|uniref:DUF2997 domain-containing protein n=1 Tax=Blastococcus sp. TF02A-26 TaxID=2250577 RepID=UPI000DE97011|nr:DUF2997 domain-containing protein [Blastococcus sp. TF02A-26]RBY84318.1 hypothetical protein DQ240_14415 [Blastococcus sp. TF02A-26]